MIPRPTRTEDQAEEGTNMNIGLGRLLMWVAEMLDRSLLTVPDADELDAHMPDASKPSHLNHGHTPVRL